jgi:hypothetical protein
MAKTFDSTFLWDLGPLKPVEPPPPSLPTGFENDEEFKRAMEMVRFRHVLAEYDIAYRAYLDEKAIYDAFGGKPKHISMTHVDAVEAMSRDPHRFVKVLPR